MNERIRELAEQCVGDRPYNSSLDYEKFAELIVRECVSVLDGMADPEEDSDRYCWAIQNASHQIKQHFGIEE